MAAPRKVVLLKRVEPLRGDPVDRVVEAARAFLRGDAPAPPPIEFLDEAVLALAKREAARSGNLSPEQALADLVRKNDDRLSALSAARNAAPAGGEYRKRLLSRESAWRLVESEVAKRRRPEESAEQAFARLAFSPDADPDFVAALAAYRDLA